MSAMWPWLTMGVGIALLIVYRFISVKPRTPKLPSKDSGTDAASLGLFERLRAAVAAEPGHETPSTRKPGGSIPPFNALPTPPGINKLVSQLPVVMPVAIHLLVLLSALYVILHPTVYIEAQKWAFGAVGTVIGSWLPKRN